MSEGLNHIKNLSETGMYEQKYSKPELKKPRTVVKDFIDEYLTDSKHCLDLGCGEGRHSRYLVGKGIETTGVDLAETGLKKAKKSLTDNKKATFLKADIHHLPFADESFDSLVSNRVLDYNDDIGLNQAFSEISRVLKNNSPILLTLRSISQIPKPNEKQIEKNTFGGATHQNEKNGSLNHYFTLEEITDLSRRHGLQIIRAQETKRKNKEGQEKSEWQIILKKINYENAI